MHHQVWVEIDLKAFDHNLNQIRQRLTPGTAVLASVKANAYGHGIVQVAGRLQAGGVDMLGVARMEEGITLRHAGVHGIPILIYGHTPPASAPSLAKYDLTTSIYSLSAARALSVVAASMETKVKVHLKIDTGMGRLGLLPDCFRTNDVRDDIADIETIVGQSGLAVTGIYTHFASADAADKTDTLNQLGCFNDLLERLAGRGIEFPLRHAANSAATFDIPQSHLDMVRPGLSLYGLYPFNDQQRRQLSLKPVMSLKARIALVKEVPAGFKVSYGGRYITPRATRIATVPIGYADGYRRALSNQGEMLVAGKRAPVVGRVCMDLTMLDVGHILEADVGSEVVIIGSQGDDAITADELANQLGTINYEVVASIMDRVPRVYI